VNDRFSFSCAGSVALTLLLASCGGGGGGGSGDVVPGTPAVQSSAAGPDSFLLFPNPQLLSDGSAETNSIAYAQAYYAAIDPLNAKDTLAKWKAANNFDSGTGTQVGAVFGDVLDLGYGRRMTARQNADGSVAITVENYQVNAGGAYGYNSLNLDAAILRDTRWHVGTNAIEFNPGPNGGASFTKFYTFNPTTGERLLVANLDGRGDKAMPGICINCHGGRADPLTPADPLTGKSLFPLVQNSVSQHRGDVQARLHMLNADHLEFSSMSGFTRAELEATVKTINKMILCTYPLAGAAAGPEDACRPAAGINEWQGAAAAVLKAAYGGNGLPNAGFSDTYVPSDWISAGRTSLYNDVAKQACMTCHILRGTNNQSDLDFTSYAKFSGYSDRIKAHVYDRGNMPLAKIVSDRFWATSMAETLGSWLQTLGYTVRDGASALLRPGRPIADPGPNRTVRFGPTTLSASGSLYASSYSWSITSNPGNAGSLTNPASATPAFTASANGTYVLQLIASNGTTQSTPASLTLVVNNALTPDPSAIRFADIKTVLQNPVTCVTCHTPPGTAAIKPPIFYSDIDRNGDGIVNATDTSWMYKEVRGRVNFTDIVASPLLRKPSNNHHNGLLQTGFDASLAPGDAGRANYDLFLNWILNGAPE